MFNLKETVEEIRKDSNDIIGLYHSHPHSKYNRNLYEFHPSWTDIYTYKKFEFEANSIFYFINEKECDKDMRNRMLTFFNEDKLYEVNAACYISTWYYDAPVTIRQAIYKIANNQYIIICGYSKKDDEWYIFENIGTGWDVKPL